MKARERKQGDGHPDTLETKNELAVLYKEQGPYDKAERLLPEAVEGRHIKLGSIHPHTLESWHNLIAMYKAWNKPEKAEKWRAKLPQTEAVEERQNRCKIISFKNGKTPKQHGDTLTPFCYHKH